MKTEQEHRYTSTGIKFWRHRAQMESYRQGTGHTVISTHIAPEGACNLKCPYCSVTHRDTHSRLELDVIKDYVEKLQTRGLKAVILTGGGEPLAYRHINQLVEWLHSKGLSIALITNGTLTDRLDPPLWKAFRWVRVSINFFEGWRSKIRLPLEHISSETTVGASFVFTRAHEALGEGNWDDRFRGVSAVATAVDADYIRVLPDCLLPQADLAESHRQLAAALQSVDDPRFFRQDKHHRAPSCSRCHQSYFRPYLSEEIYLHDGKGEAGSVYPCDSVVLNDGVAKFVGEYQLCKPGDVLKYLDGEITAHFDPRKSCSGCVFTDNVEMLGRWEAGKEDRFSEFQEELKHEEFV